MHLRISFWILSVGLNLPGRLILDTDQNSVRDYFNSFMVVTNYFFQHCLFSQYHFVKGLNMGPNEEIKFTAIKLYIVAV